MSIPCVVGAVRPNQEWSGVYVSNDGGLTGVGAKLIAELNKQHGNFENVMSKVRTSLPGWRQLFVDQFDDEPKSPCPNGVTSRMVKRADPAYVYLFGPEKTLTVLCLDRGNANNHELAGLKNFEVLCTIPIADKTDADALQRHVAPSIVWEAKVTPGWFGESVDRKEVADVLDAAKRDACRAELAEVLKAALPTENGRMAVRYGDSSSAYETDLGGLTVRTLGDRSPSGKLELLSEGEAVASIDQVALLAELKSSRPVLHDIAERILKIRAGWLLEVLAWVRQGTVSDAIKGHMPAREFQHADGRKWSIELIPLGGASNRSRLSIKVIDAEGDVFARSRDVDHLQALKDMASSIKEIEADGFKATA